MELLAIVWSFFKIGVVSFGGGWSIVGLIKTEVVPHWIDEAGFGSLVAIAQSTPGPVALNAATLVGWQRQGILGALAATLSVVAFPALAIAAAGLLAARVRVRAAALQESLRTGTLAMMGMTLWVLLPRGAIDPVLAALGLGSFCLATFTKINPLWAILGAGAVNALARAIFP
jgi:chromate transporter